MTIILTNARTTEQMFAALTAKLPPELSSDLAGAERAALYGKAAVLALAEQRAELLLGKEQSRQHAEGAWLDMLGAEKKIYRTAGETDAAFMARIPQVADGIAPAIIEAAVNDILSAAFPGQGVLCRLAGHVQDGAYFGDDSVDGSDDSIAAFFSTDGNGGDLWDSQPEDQTAPDLRAYTVFLPTIVASTTTEQAICDTVNAMTAAGISAWVQIDPYMTIGA